MKLQELTTEELVNIDGGGVGTFLYDLCYITLRGVRFGSDLSDALGGNSNFGNPSAYK